MRAAAVAIAFLMLLPVAASAQSPDDGTLIRSVDEPAEALRVTKRLPSSGLPAFARATGKGILVRAPESAPAVERALAFLEGYGKSFGIADRAAVRLLREERRDKVGMEHVRFQQIHRGVPVTGGEIVIHIRGARVVVVSARIVLVPNIDIAPRLKPSQATAAAAKVVAGLRGKFSPKIKYSTPRLEIFNRAHLGGRPLPTRLTWFVVASGPELNEYIWVDAQTGEVLLHFNQFPDARQREIFSTSTSTEDGRSLRRRHRHLGGRRRQSALRRSLRERVQIRRLLLRLLLAEARARQLRRRGRNTLTECDRLLGRSVRIVPRRCVG